MASARLATSFIPLRYVVAQAPNAWLRRTAVLRLGLVLASSVWGCAIVGVAHGQQPAFPNIVIIMADDLGIGDLGVTGQLARAAAGLPAIATPNIDSIAQAGMRFNSMYAGAATCSPSRLSLLTGFHQGHTYFDRANVDQDIRGGDQDRTWGQVLQDAGYETGLFGKWHLGGVLNTVREPSATPVQKGFETAYMAPFRYPLLWQHNGSGSMMLSRTPSDPSYTGPGSPYQFGEDFNTDRAVEFIRSNASSAKPFAAYLPYLAPHTPLDYVPPNHPYADKPWPKAARDYAGLLHNLDQNVGRVLRALDDPNGDGSPSDSVASNTLVIFTSDNGPNIRDPNSGYDPEFFDSNGIYQGSKFLTLEGGIRVPFFARWNGTIPAGTINNAHVGDFTDIMPTLTELVGRQAPVGIDGRSMVETLKTGFADQPPKVMYWSMEREVGPANPGGWTVRVGDWKLTKNRPTSLLPNGNYRLTNVATDPREVVNRATSRPDIVAALEQIAIAEGADREPLAPTSSGSTILETKNTYFTQYKTWAPQGQSSDFFAASNWSGGTQTGYPGDVAANNWNTGPADNWLAMVSNASGNAPAAIVRSNASVLAMEIRGGVGLGRAAVQDGAVLSARNGLRISSGGQLDLLGGELNTVRDIEVAPGGRLSGYGLINGQQDVVAGIPEFAGKGLFEPRLVNEGVVSIDGAVSGVPGDLTIRGDYRQGPGGRLTIDLFASSAGAIADHLTGLGSVTLGGLLEVRLAPQITVSLGDSFQVISASQGLNGFFSQVVASSPGPGLSWAMQYGATSASLTVVNLPGSSGGQSDFLTKWRSAFGTSSSGDLDHDGDSDGADFLAWQRSGMAESALAQWKNPKNSTVAGDWDGDGDSDGGDFLSWQRSAGELTPLNRWIASFGSNDGGDRDGDGDTDGRDFLLWQHGMGAVNAASARSIPEPATVGGLLTSLVTLAPWRRRHRAST